VSMRVLVPQKASLSQLEEARPCQQKQSDGNIQSLA